MSNKIPNKISIYFLNILYLLFLSPCFGSDDLDSEKNDSLHISTLKEEKTIDLAPFKHGKGEIIYIYGSSTSGKSTLCGLLKQTYPHAPLLAGRDFKNQYIISLVKKTFPEQYGFVSSAMSDENIIKYLYFGNLVLHPEFQNDHDRVASHAKHIKDNIFLVDQQYDGEAFLKLLFDHAFSLSLRGETVFIDNLEIEFFLNYLKNSCFTCPLRFVLLYCSPAHLMDRVKERNTVADQHDKLDMRPYLRPLLTYAQLFKRKESILEETPVLDTIDSKDILQIYKKAYEKDKEVNLPVWVTIYSDKDKDMWPQLKAHVCKTFNIYDDINNQPIEICARFPFDIFFNTKISSASECVASIQIFPKQES